MSIYSDPSQEAPLLKGVALHGFVDVFWIFIASRKHQHVIQKQPCSSTSQQSHDLNMQDQEVQLSISCASPWLYQNAELPLWYNEWCPPHCWSSEGLIRHMGPSRRLRPATNPSAMVPHGPLRPRRSMSS